MSTEGKNTVIEFLSEFLEESNNIESEAFKKIFEKINEEKQKIEKFLEDYIYPIILNDNLFSYEEEKENLLKLEEEKKALFYQLEKFWLYEKFVIAFAGRFSSGKSSVINTLLGVKQLLPTDVTPTTAIPTYLTSLSGLNEDKLKDKFLVVSQEENNGSPKAKLMDLKYLLELRHNDLKTTKIPLTRFINSFVIFPETIKHLSSISANLANLALADTPGFDSSDKESDRVFTRETLINSDVVFWVIDINDGDISKHALEFLKELGRNDGLPFDLYIILNKADTKPPKAVEKVKQQVEKSLRENNIPFKGVIPFSAKKPDKFGENLIFLRNLIFKQLSEKALEKSPKYLFFNYLEEILTHSETKISNSLKELLEEFQNEKVVLESLIKEKQNKLKTIMADLNEYKYILLEIEKFIENSKDTFALGKILWEFLQEIFRKNYPELKTILQKIAELYAEYTYKTQNNQDSIKTKSKGEWKEFYENYFVKQSFVDTVFYQYAEYESPLFGSNHWKIYSGYNFVNDLQENISNYLKAVLEGVDTLKEDLFIQYINLLIDYIILKKEILHYEKYLEFLEKESLLSYKITNLQTLREKVEEAKRRVSKYKKEVKTIEETVQKTVQNITTLVKGIINKLVGG